MSLHERAPPLIADVDLQRKIMNQISRRSLFGAAAAASVLPVASGLAAFSPIAAAAEAPKKARTIAEIAAMSPVDMAHESAVVQTAYEIIRTAARPSSRSVPTAPVRRSPPGALRAPATAATTPIPAAFAPTSPSTSSRPNRSLTPTTASTAFSLTSIMP